MSDVPLAFSVSAISAPPLMFFESVSLLEQHGIDRIHVDVMDGRFVPRFGLYPEFVNEIRNITSLPIDIHLMVSRPLEFIQDFVNVGATRIILHVESSTHLHRAIGLARETGAEVGLALNPHTTFESLAYVVEDLSSVMLMAINPGIVGHQLIESTWSKIGDLRQILNKLRSGCEIEIDGGVTFENLAGLRDSGADSVVIGAGTVFKPGRTVEQNIEVLNAIRYGH